MMTFDEFVNTFRESVLLMYREGAVYSQVNEGFVVVSICLVVTYSHESEQFVATNRLTMSTKSAPSLLDALPSYMRTTP